MKQLITLAFFLVLTIGTTQESKTASIEVEITNINNDKGILMVGLYNSESTWLKKIYIGISSEIKDGAAKATFTNIHNGTYAIAVYHDEDADGKLDMFLGMMPTEDTGASNNAPAKFGPPKWADAKFEMNGKTIYQSIKL